MLCVGMMLETFFHRIHYWITKTHYKEHHFTWGKYLYYLLFPLLTFGVSIYENGWNVVQVFLIFAFLGTFLEWMVGFTYHKIVGVRLWTYHKYSITRYTSFLSIPLWGFAGILFWHLARVLQ